MDHTAHPAVRWMTRAEAAAHLRISPRQLDRLKLPRSYLAGSKSPRFLQTDIDKAMGAAAVTPTAANVVPFTGTSHKAIRPIMGAVVTPDRKVWLREMRLALAA